MGEEQSGIFKRLDFHFIWNCWNKPLKALKSGKEPGFDKPLQHGAEIDLQMPALIPEIIIPDVHTRLTFYKRIANAKTDEEFKELQVEMIDRFGLLPKSTKNLFRMMELKLKAEPLGIRKIDAGPKSGRIEFDSEPNIDLQQMIRMIQIAPKIYKLDSAQRLQFAIADETPEARFNAVIQVLEKLRKKI